MVIRGDSDLAHVREWVLRGIVIGFAMLAIGKSPAHAFRPNESLRKEVSASSTRTLPKGENYAFAVDGFLFKSSQALDYYHGNGYWLEGRAEYAPVEQIILNTKLIFFNGASSYGYARDNYIHSFVGATYEDRFDCDGCYFRARGSDVGRQTIGMGLNLEQEEIIGGVVEAGYGDWRYRILASGTGAYFINDDLWWQQIDYGNNLIGFGAGIWIGPESSSDQRVPPVQSIFSEIPLQESTLLQLEGSHRAGAIAGMARIKSTLNIPRLLEATLAAQARYYGDGFSNGISGRVVYDYLGYDSRNKDFTNAKTVFALFGEQVTVYAVHANIRIPLSRRFEIFSENEGGVYLARSGAVQRYFFYNQGVSFFPIQGRRDSFAVFATNKFIPGLNAQYQGDPLRATFTNLPFFDAFAVTAEARIAF
jgi:hypothetical protein